MKQMDTICLQLENLAKLVELTQKTGVEAMAAIEKASLKELQMKLVALTKKNSIDAYQCIIPIGHTNRRLNYELNKHP